VPTPQDELIKQAKMETENKKASISQLDQEDKETRLEIQKLMA